jgi:hypothetical protein
MRVGAELVDDEVVLLMGSQTSSPATSLAIAAAMIYLSFPMK